MEVQKDKGRRVEHKVVRWPTGYSFPEPGGILDQQEWLIAMFDSFIEGERSAAMQSLKK